jgi:hypothetical protein
VVVLVVAALLPAVQAVGQHGWGRGVVALLGGCLVLIAAPLLTFAFGYTLAFVQQAGPRYPLCHNGKCKGRRWPSLSDRDLGDYERTTVDGESVLRCGCGLEYVAREAGWCILRRLPDGTLQPHMVHRNYRGWGVDDSAE